MHTRYCLIPVVACLFTVSAQSETLAGEIDFDDTPVNFQGFVVGDNKVTNQTTPTLNKLKNGYEIRNFSFTANQPGEIQWQASRAFDLKSDSAEDVSVSIFGNTRIILTGGRATFKVIGGIDDGITVDFEREIQGPFNEIVPWNKTGIEKGVSPGSHTLDLVVGVDWAKGADTDTITVSSLYGITAAVPEPASTLSLLALSTLGAVSTLKRQLKPSKSSKKETTKVG